MGFALWLDRENGLAWAQGTQEYRPMGTAVIAIAGQFHHRDFQQTRERPAHLERSFVGFFGSLEEINVSLTSASDRPMRLTPVLYRSATSGKIPKRR
jgi:hypothetical protein